LAANSQQNIGPSDADKIELVSVIIPCFNSEKTIVRCVLSVLEAKEPQLEIIVVDDASIDQSPQLVKDLAKDHSDTIKLYRQMINGGPAKARNAGAARAKGRYLFFLDSDTEMGPNALKNFRNRILVADAVIGVYDKQPLNSGWVPLYKALLDNYLLSCEGIINYEVFDSAKAGIRADIFKALSGFNETLAWGMDCENEELGYRICKRFKQILDPSIIVKHNFPGFWQLTKVYFHRVALWVEILVYRKKFNSGGATSGVGLSSASLLASTVLLLLTLLPISAESVGIIVAISIPLFLVYLCGYRGFFKFVFRRSPCFIIPCIVLNLYFTLTISLGACYGLLRTVTGSSNVKKLKSFDCN
jgi:glycosyltransferase involved in cell wall biosynthesis